LWHSCAGQLVLLGYCLLGGVVGLFGALPSSFCREISVCKHQVSLPPALLAIVRCTYVTYVTLLPLPPALLECRVSLSPPGPSPPHARSSPLPISLSVSLPPLPPCSIANSKLVGGWRAKPCAAGGGGRGKAHGTRQEVRAHAIIRASDSEQWRCRRARSAG